MIAHLNSTNRLSLLPALSSFRFCTVADVTLNFLPSSDSSPALPSAPFTPTRSSTASFSIKYTPHSTTSSSAPIFSITFYQILLFPLRSVIYPVFLKQCVIIRSFLLATYTSIRKCRQHCSVSSTRTTTAHPLHPPPPPTHTHTHTHTHTLIYQTALNWQKGLADCHLHSSPPDALLAQDRIRLAFALFWPPHHTLLNNQHAFLFPPQYPVPIFECYWDANNCDSLNDNPAAVLCFSKTPAC
ncbi:uncharacterized protein MONOS_2231 [Monocercomonoides exilis]|uniref:uncharacterized protein n=1 Tax=Monocercomonoides exilis TaxID=2049356 RepID=UPI00355AB453|nr:hypothetical protein MONOS_2231 [Monocercomonoides exilis]